MNPSPMVNLAHLLAEQQDPNIFLKVLSDLADELGPVILRMLITVLTDLLVDALDPDHEDEP